MASSLRKPVDEHLDFKKRHGNCKGFRGSFIKRSPLNNGSSEMIMRLSLNLQQFCIFVLTVGKSSKKIEDQYSKIRSVASQHLFLLIRLALNALKT